MADFTFHLCDSLDDTVIAELPISTASFGEVLNAPGSATLTTALNLEDFEVSIIQPLRQSIFILRDGVPLWGGILWAANMDVVSNTLTLNAQGFWSLVRARRIASTLTYTGVDQALIAKGIVDAVQAVPNGDMLIDTSAISAVGVTRDRTYYNYERKNAAEAVEQLAAVRDGFDFAVRPVLSGGAYVRRMTVSYPATGRITNIVLDAGTNVELLSATVDATKMALRVHAKGEGEGPEGLLTTQANAPLLGSYPLVEALVVHTDVKESATLVAHAQRALDIGKAPIVIPTVVLYGDREPRPGTYVTGDRVRVRANYGLLNIDASYRITQWTLILDENGKEAANVTLAPLEVFESA